MGGGGRLAAHCSLRGRRAGSSIGIEGANALAGAATTLSAKASLGKELTEQLCRALELKTLSGLKEACKKAGIMGYANKQREELISLLSRIPTAVATVRMRFGYLRSVLVHGSATCSIALSRQK